MKKYAAPVTAAILIALPLLYVGAYFAFVTPNRTVLLVPMKPPTPAIVHTGNYRMRDPLLQSVFWPLEQIDRKVRPAAWE